MGYDLERWLELIEMDPDLEDTPEHRRAATLEQAFGPVASGYEIEVRPTNDHEWRPTARGWHCARCGLVSLGDIQYAMSGETWTIAPRYAGGCRR